MAMKRYSSVENCLEELEYFQAEVIRLREIIAADAELVESLKWSIPSYAYHGKNLVGIGSFKSYFGIWFYQGAAMEDPDQVLINAQEGKTRAMRQWRMTSRKEIKVRQIKAYLKRAKAVIDSGNEVKVRRNQPIIIHPLLRSALDQNKAAKQAFQAMRPGCQREYANYVNDAKRDETKVRRIAKVIPMIIAGGGLNDRYRS